MPIYKYQVKDSSGNNNTGTLTADSLDEATEMLRRGGKTVVSVTEDFFAAQSGKRKKIKRDEVIFFATQLAVMVDTGVPLDEALESIANQCENLNFVDVLNDICQQVQGGTEFSTALEKYPKLFDSLFVSLMRASEISGTMGQMLQRTSEYMEQERQTVKNIKGAMTYPVCMLSFCVLVVIALLVFILPRFEKIYAGKDAILPLPTRILLGMSHAMVDYWPFMIGGLIALVSGAIYSMRTPDGVIAVDKLRINMPLLGPMFRKACLARSLRTMATMVGTGVGILDGLEITSRVSGNSQYAKIWTDVAERVKEGESLSQHLLGCKLIPRTITQMVDAGERTGKLPMVMNRVAVFCEDDLKIAIKAMTSMIEPAMIIIMGLLVGGIAMAMLLPVFKLSNVVSR